jgi:hypothetical protein
MSGPDDGGKSPLQSKTIHFNASSGLLITAIMPLIPPDIRHSDLFMNSIIAWFSIFNILLRYFTKCKIDFSGG